MQGESNVDNTESIANLKLLRDSACTFRNNDLLIVIGKISDSGSDVDGRVWDFCELAQYAQGKYATAEIIFLEVF
jgi:hypothetical protein